MSKKELNQTIDGLLVETGNLAVIAALSDPKVPQELVKPVIGKIVDEVVSRFDLLGPHLPFYKYVVFERVRERYSGPVDLSYTPEQKRERIEIEEEFHHSQIY